MVWPNRARARGVDRHGRVDPRLGQGARRPDQGDGTNGHAGARADGNTRPAHGDPCGHRERGRGRERGSGRGREGSGGRRERGRQGNR